MALSALAPDAPPSLELPIQLNRGLALFQMRRLEESTRALEPLTSTYYRYSIPALYHLAKSYQALAAAIDPTVNKIVVEKVGTVKVRVGKGKNRKTVTQPKFANVKRTVKLVDIAKKEKKDEYESLSVERLKDLLQLQLAHEVRLEVLNTLIAVAESKNQDDYEQELIRRAAVFLEQGLVRVHVGRPGGRRTRFPVHLRDLCESEREASVGILVRANDRARGTQGGRCRDLSAPRGSTLRGPLRDSLR